MIDSNRDSTLPLRGVNDEAFAVRPEVQITTGASFAPGKYQLLAGVKAAQTFAHLNVGNQIQIRGQQYLVTGHFSADGSATETELWVDQPLLARTLGRDGAFSSALVQPA